MSGHQGLRCLPRELFDGRIRVTGTDQSDATRVALCHCADIAQAGARVDGSTYRDQLEGEKSKCVE
jgi:hypothetical protein